MSSHPEITSFERVDLEGAPASRKDAAAFLERFDTGRVPTSPGCYLMRDAKDRVIYVGKAKSLRARIRSYIQETDTRYMIQFLMKRVASIDFLVTTNEKEAVLLENSLIKQHKPRYNVRLRDDKTYVSVKVNVGHRFPRVTVTRNLRKDGSRYFGPYASAQAVRETLRQLQRIFPLRTCSDNVLNNRARPCLYYQMKQCTAPCTGYIGEEAYREIVNQVLLVLEGRNDEVEKLLLGRIQAHAKALEFEQAAELRDRLYALRETLERQRTVRAGGADERDVFGAYTHGRFSEIQVLYFRSGKMLGGRSFSFNQRETPFAEVLGSFLLQYYADAPHVPAEVLVPVDLDDAEVLEELLAEQRGGKVLVRCPRRGDKVRLVEMAARNAETSFNDKRLTEKADADLVALTRSQLHLRKAPKRIECFDISTTQGTNAVGSMAAFENGRPDKAGYRRYSIKRVEGQDDFAMMREVLMRRFRRAIEEDDLPDLALIDGGKGQLGVAEAVFKDLGIEDQETVGMAKARPGEGGARGSERFYLRGRKNPIILPENSPVVLFLTRVRDEAHRFAVTYHRKKRGKTISKSPLTEIPGIGGKRARTLLTRLGSLKRVREAPVETIAELPGFSQELARTVKQHLAESTEPRGKGNPL